MGLISGRQWKVELVGDVKPEWGNDEIHIGIMIQSAINMNMLLMGAFSWSNVSFTRVGESFPTPAPIPQKPKVVQ